MATSSLRVSLRPTWTVRVVRRQVLRFTDSARPPRRRPGPRRPRSRARRRLPPRDGCGDGNGGRSDLVVRVTAEFQIAPSLIHRIWRDVKGSKQSHRAFAEGSLAVQYHKVGMFEHEQEVKNSKAGVAGSNHAGGTRVFAVQR